MRMAILSRCRKDAEPWQKLGNEVFTRSRLRAVMGCLEHIDPLEIIGVGKLSFGLC